MKGSHWERAWLPGSYRPLEGAGWPIIRDQESKLQLEAHRSPDYGQACPPPPGQTPSWLSTFSHYSEAALGWMKCSVQAWGVLLLQSLNLHLPSLHPHGLNHISSVFSQRSHSVPPKSLFHIDFFFPFVPFRPLTSETWGSNATSQVFWQWLVENFWVNLLSLLSLLKVVPRHLERRDVKLNDVKCWKLHSLGSMCLPALNSQGLTTVHKQYSKY